MSDSDSDSDFCEDIREHMAAVSCYPPTEITAFNQSIVFCMSITKFVLSPGDGQSFNDNLQSIR